MENGPMSENRPILMRRLEKEIVNEVILQYKSFIMSPLITKLTSESISSCLIANKHVFLAHRFGLSQNDLSYVVQKIIHEYRQAVNILERKIPLQLLMI